MFAIALWDRETRTLTLARDRLGEKPLYYGWQNSVMLFGSELNAPKTHPAFVGEIDRDALALFLRHNAIRPEEHTSELQSLMRRSYAVFCLTNKYATYKQ